MADRFVPKHSGKLPSVETLKNLVRDGHGSNQIADLYGVTQEYTRQRLKYFGLTPPRNSEPRPLAIRPTMQLRHPQGPITLPRVSMIASMEKYA